MKVRLIILRSGLVGIEGLFTVLMCADCQATRGYGAGPYPIMTRAEMRLY